MRMDLMPELERIVSEEVSFSKLIECEGHGSRYRVLVVHAPWNRLTMVMPLDTAGYAYWTGHFPTAWLDWDNPKARIVAQLSNARGADNYNSILDLGVIAEAIIANR